MQVCRGAMLVSGNDRLVCQSCTRSPAEIDQDERSRFYLFREELFCPQLPRLFHGILDGGRDDISENNLRAGSKYPKPAIAANPCTLRIPDCDKTLNWKAWEGLFRSRAAFVRVNEF